MSQTYSPARAGRGAMLHITEFTVAERSTALCGASVTGPSAPREASEFIQWPNDYCKRCVAALTKREGQ